MDVLKEIFTAFITSSFISKLLIFVSAFFAPVWELYILLIFLVIVDYLIDLGVWFFKHKKEIKCWTVTQPFVLKLIMYSILVITVNAVQLHLVKEAFQFFKLVIAIPIISSLLEIVATVERTTGIAIVEKVKEYLGNWIGAQAPKKED